MPKAVDIFDRHKLAAAALAVSAALHAAVMVGVPSRLESAEAEQGTAYSATLDPGTTAGDIVPAPKPAAKPAHKPRTHSHFAPPAPIAPIAAAAALPQMAP